MDRNAASPSDQASTAPRTRLGYDGRSGEISAIIVGNMLLGIVTLGFYRFWGKTRLRRYVWSHVGFHGEPFEYTGRAKELFIGFLVGLAVLIPFIVVSGLLESAVDNEEAGALVGVLEATVFYFLIQMAQYRARRYRLNRTVWSGIRAAQTGSATRYGLVALAHGVLLLSSLGLTLPWMRTTLQRIRLRNTWFGDRALTFDARARTLMPTWLLCWVLLLPSLGLSYLWYRAAEFRHFAAHAGYDRLRFESDLSGASLAGVVAILGLFVVVLFFAVALVSPLFGIIALSDIEQPVDDVTNMGFILLPAIVFLVAVVLFGALYRVILFQRLLPVVLRRLAIVGTADFDAIAQSTQAALSRGEGLTDAFDVGEF